MVMFDCGVCLTLPPSVEKMKREGAPSSMSSDWLARSEVTTRGRAPADVRDD
jgi:hypothetical protein